MTARLLFFAGLRQRLKRTEQDVVVAAGTTAQDIFFGLFTDRREAEMLFASVRCAVNCEYVPAHTIVRPGDEVAYIPPVSGG